MLPGRGEGRSAQLISTKTYLVKNGQATLDQTQRRRSGSESRPKHSAGSRNQTESPCAKWVMSVPLPDLSPDTTGEYPLSDSPKPSGNDRQQSRHDARHDDGAYYRPRSPYGRDPSPSNTAVHRGEPKTKSYQPGSRQTETCRGDSLDYRGESRVDQAPAPRRHYVCTQITTSIIPRACRDVSGRGERDSGWQKYPSRTDKHA